MTLLRLLKRDLARETSEWVNDGIIQVNQAEQICQRYGIDYHHQQDNHFGYYVLVVLGYLFIGLALMVLIGHNWQEIPRGLRMTGVIAITLTVNLLGLRAWAQDKLRSATTWLFLGGLCYGASIMLIAQIYHLGAHYPDGILYWALGVLPLALLTRSTLLMLLTATLALIWFFTETSHSYYPLMFPVFLLALGWHVFKVKHSGLLFLVFILALAMFFIYNLAWIGGNLEYFDLEEEHLLITAMLAVLFYGFARWLYMQKNPVYKDYGTLLGIWTLRISVLLWFILSFKDPWQGMMRHNWTQPGLILVITSTISFSAVALAYLPNRSMKNALATLAYVVLFNISLLAILFLDREYARIMQVFANLVLIFAGTWLIAKGVQEAISHYFYLGIITIMITALLRYIDLVGDYIGASILFAIFAFILLAVARFWKKRLMQNTEGGVA